MKKLKKTDIAARKAFKTAELEKRLFKNVYDNNFLLTQIKWKALELSQRHGSACSKAKSVNRCIETISRKSVHKGFRLSRLSLIKLIRTGKINGVKKSVW